MPEDLAGLGCDGAALFEALVCAANEANIGLFACDVLDVPPRALYVSEAIARMLGRSREEILGTNLWELFDEEERLRLQQMSASRNRGALVSPLIEATIRGRDGGPLPVELAVARLQVEGRVLSLGFLFDLSARRRAEMALVASEARFRVVVESAPDGVLILRGDRIVFLNPRAAAMLGTPSREHALGASLLDLLPSGDGRARLGGLAAGHLVPDAFTYVLANPGGRQRVIEVSSIPIEYEGAPALMALARDVTERKAIESKLLLTDRLAAVGTLAAGITHEINNPLSYVLLNLERLRRELDGLAPGMDPERAARMQKSIDDAHHGAARIESIVRGLRTFARLEDEARGPVDVAVVLDSAVRLAENEIRHRARLVREQEPVPLVEANPGRLEQVFLNLLVNAAQALAEGDATRDEIRVVLREHPRGRVMVEICDTGPGIPPEVIDHVFDPFFSTKPVGVGTGLGLTICQNIVSALGGDIQVTSLAGKGTRVRILLSALEVAAARVAPPALERPIPPAPLGDVRRRVLVVDDDEAVAKSVAMVLEEACEVTLALSGAEALEALGRAGWPDAILVDVMMPGMNGADLHRAVAQRWPGLEQRIVFVTGGTFDSRLQAFLEQVQNPRLHKPLETAAVLAAIVSVAPRSAAALD